ncbi:hypothetical protein RJT34_17466 [Clitoria ternatea]|uniref:caffeate O-methyltransferase n=1 Tax=Clitoria ternatea TaxID=43366 RepID=A0AAN9J9E2_CLITE
MNSDLTMDPSLQTSSNGSETKHLKQEGVVISTQEDQDGALFAINMIASVVFPLALRTAVELGIFDIIAKGGEGVKLSAEEIAEQLGTDNPEAPTMLDRLLRFLASHSMLSCSVAEQDQQKHSSPKRLYGLTYASKYFVTDADGVSLGAAMNFTLDKVFFRSWSGLKGGILEGGIAFNRVYGKSIFEYLAIDPEFSDVFNKCMFSITTTIMKRILEVYQGFEHINRLVDVGGNLGINLKLITSKYPHIQAVNFDLPHVIHQAQTYPRVEHVGGDMFESVPNGDAIFMKWILHDWSDEDCLKLLKNCYKAIPEDGKVIVVEQILPVLPENTTAAQSGFQADLLMLTQNHGGKERTQNEYMELALASGYSGITFVCSVSGFSVMEFFK